MPRGRSKNLTAHHAALLILVLGIGCSSQNTLRDTSRDDAKAETQDRELVAQVSTLPALVDGLYQGFTTIGEMETLGDFGLGTFEHLHGEMVQVDGRVYRITAEGRVERVDPSETSPFFVTTFFDRDRTHRIPRVDSMDHLVQQLDEQLQPGSFPLAIRIDGTFEMLKARSVFEQEEPYPPLRQAVATQAVFDLEQVSGTMVGFWFPKSLGQVNLAGYHFHFVAEQRQSGGHVLDLRGGNLSVTVDETPRFQLMLPEESTAFRQWSQGTTEAGS